MKKPREGRGALKKLSFLSINLAEAAANKLI
jgi:hypothetical protein